MLNLIHLSRRLASAASIVATTFALFALLFFALSDTLQAAGIQPVRPSTSRLQAPPNCVEQIVNGSFEEIGAGWSSVAGASLFTYATDQFAGGRRSLLLGITDSSNITATFGVEQLLQLPAESTSIAFSFAYQVLVSGGADAGDQAYLTIYDADANQLLAMLVLSPTSSSWSVGRYDLTPLAGKNIRLAFSAQNDGEPGRLAMRVDDVSILACLPVEEFALTPLPTPTPTVLPATPAPLILTPLPLPQSPAPLPPITSTLPPAQSQSAIIGQSGGATAPGSISSLDQCSCAGSAYTCSDFSSWSMAQACFTRCQVTAGYDIHYLDPDRDGIACELELQDIASLTDTSAAQSASLITQTAPLTPAANSGIESGVVASTMTSPPLNPPAANLSSTAPSTITTATAISASTMVQTPAVPLASAVTTSGAVSSAGLVSAQVAAVPVTPVGTAEVAAGSGRTLTTSSDLANPAASLSPAQLLALFLVSPFGVAAVVVLAILGGLCLLLAYLLGRHSGQAKQKPPVVVNGVPDEFVLQPKNEVSSTEL